MKDTTSKGLHTAITRFIQEYGIPYFENMIRFAVDGTSVMFGTNDGVAAKVKTEIAH
ncbi:MAG: hypothetical protein H9Q67_05480 [Spiroplasma ixodetis]|nr:hypothetical protein [Spiroplasma ixodetis]